jgi:apolipoprotein D and lipocalin family protein
MSGMIHKLIGMSLGFLALSLAFCLRATGQTVTPVPRLDLNKFTGTWYEVARYPNKRQKHCAGDAMMLIARGDKANQIQFVSSCETKSPYADVKNGKGKSQDKSGDGKLKVSYMWPFSSKYWVIGLGDDYQWSLIGSPNHKNLWVLSRTPVLKPEVFADIQERARAQGFPLANLAMTQQTAP